MYRIYVNHSFRNDFMVTFSLDLNKFLGVNYQEISSRTLKNQLDEYINQYII